MSGRPLLVIDTATTQAVIALGTADGTLIDQRGWVAGYRHGEELLAQIAGLLADRGTAATDLGGIIVGTGPGAFTGLRVGIATAKGLAHGLRLPIVGLATGAALIHAAAAASGLDSGALVLAQPAGMSDRVVSRNDEAARIIPGGAEPDLRPGDHLVAVDLAGRVPEDAARLGEAAVAGLAAAMLAAGAARLIAGDVDDLALLVPEYVTLPRGVRLALPDEGVVVSGGLTDPTGATGAAGGVS
jgi:tRNA threonylcarbamoyladenosine biosynthesis protein TsaB